MFPSTFRRLEVFIAVVEAGGFIAGADRLGISHPSVSNHVKALERQVGCKLFARRKGIGANLTEQGRRLYERPTRLLQEASLLTRDLAPNRAGLKRPPSEESGKSSGSPDSVLDGDAIAGNDFKDRLQSPVPKAPLHITRCRFQMMIHGLSLTLHRTERQPAHDVPLQHEYNRENRQ
jgi:molybdenum-dependent DNA-binding transcriptional regulator ModE